MATQIHLPQPAYERAEINPGSTEEFTRHLAVTHTEPVANSTVTVSNRELGYVPPAGDQTPQAHPKAAAAAIRMGLNG